MPDWNKRVYVTDPFGKYAFKDSDIRETKIRERQRAQLSVRCLRDMLMMYSTILL